MTLIESSENEATYDKSLLFPLLYTCRNKLPPPLTQMVVHGITNFLGWARDYFFTEFCFHAQRQKRKLRIPKQGSLPIRGIFLKIMNLKGKENWHNIFQFCSHPNQTLAVVLQVWPGCNFPGDNEDISFNFQAIAQNKTVVQCTCTRKMETLLLYIMPLILHKGCVLE